MQTQQLQVTFKYNSFSKFKVNFLLINMANTNPVWFITGTSTGIGRSIAHYALSQGYRVVATARNVQSLNDLMSSNPNNVLALPLDVTKKSDITATIDQAVKVFGRIDVLINNAGYLVTGAVEDISDEDVRKQFDTNFFGALAVTQSVLPILRAQGFGAIVQNSSVLGSLTFPSTGIYSASKFALEAFSEALSQEVADFGIKVLIIQPGHFRTSILDKGVVVAKLSQAYEGGPVEQVMSSFNAINGKQPGNPDLVGKVIDDALKSAKSPLRLPLGNNSFDYIVAKKTALLKELRVWESVSKSTDFE